MTQISCALSELAPLFCVDSMMPLLTRSKISRYYFLCLYSLICVVIVGNPDCWISDAKAQMFFSFRKYLLVDPVDREEKVMDGRMVIGMNKHREICTLQITGQMLLMKEQV